MGLIPIGESRDSAGNASVQFASEQPVRYGRIALIMVTLASVIMFFAGMNGSVAFALLGLAALVLSIVVWKETRFARIMYGLTPGMKIVARTVLVIGTVLAFCTIIGIFLGFSGDHWRP
jgi:nicotinamide riboside transporter PnuC